MNEYQETLIQGLEFFGLAWWVEIKTESPRCTYYFGPFFSRKDALGESEGYVNDLKEEEAVGISVQVKRMKPTELTIFDELGEIQDHKTFPVLSGQLL